MHPNDASQRGTTDRVTNEVNKPGALIQGLDTYNWSQWMVLVQGKYCEMGNGKSHVLLNKV